MRLVALGVGVWLAAALPGAHADLVTAATRASSGAAAMPKSLPLKRDEVAASEAPHWQLPALLLGLIAVGGATVAWGRHRPGVWRALRAGTEARESIVVLARQPLTPQVSVYALRWGSEDLLVSCSSQQVTVIARRDVPAQGDPQ
jgi:hypothetical protein